MRNPMLHKRCDIKTLLDETIKRERKIRTDTDDEQEAYMARYAEWTLQEIRDAIFDARLPE